MFLFIRFATRSQRSLGRSPWNYAWSLCAWLRFIIHYCHLQQCDKITSNNPVVVSFFSIRLTSNNPIIPMGASRRSITTETVMHHRHEFVLYSLQNIEPMKVDMHNLGVWDSPRSNFVPLRRCAAAFKRRYSLSVVAFGAPANNTLQ